MTEDARPNEVSVRRPCELRGVSRLWLHEQQGQEVEDADQVFSQDTEVVVECRRYGYRRVTCELAR